ncbi:MAG: hypothetical protein JWL92_121 [Candidatus Nomurabacteria bacterium]|nr:hypothetical protein [Candidatus Nomurabacteria bacterium]
MEKLWFKRKRYGYGWVPVTYQGWLVILAYIVGATVLGNLTKNYTSQRDIVIGLIIPMVILTIVLLIVCVLKGEKPRWQWGKDRE